MSTEIPWSQVKALSFDIYGTLIDWENGILTSARETALGPFLPVDNRTVLLDIEKHDTGVQAKHPTWRQTEIIAEGLREYARALKVVENGHLTTDQVDAAAKDYGTKIGTYPAFHDTVKAIQRLANRFKLIPLSNVDRKSFEGTLTGPLNGCHFDAIYTAEDIGSYKPDLRNFDYLLEHVKADFGLEKDQLCHVAQSLFHDHEPAKQKAIQSVWVDRKGVMGAQTAGAADKQTKFGFKLRVETLAELADIIDEALKA